MQVSLPPEPLEDRFGIATLSLGDWRSHKLLPRLNAAAAAGFKFIDLFDECWAAYLEENGLDGAKLWEPLPENLRVARELGQLVKSLGMTIACTQPLRNIEGIRDIAERQQALDLVAKRFPFMRAFDTDLVFMCSSIRKDPGVTSDLKTVARDLAQLGLMAEDFSVRDGGQMLRIGYEGLSWAVRNTWSSSWEVVRFANRHNVGLIVDAFNVLAVEYADPYNPAGHGRIYEDPDDSMSILRASMTALANTVPGDKIFFFQCGDAELVDPKKFSQPADADTPALLPWSRSHRLFPFEKDRGAYMPTEVVTAAVLATGYTGPISLEVFNASLHLPDPEVPEAHAQRGVVGLRKLVASVRQMASLMKRGL